MKVRNVGLPVGEIVDVSAEHGEYLLKLFGKKFVTVTDESEPVAAAVDSETDKPRVRGKVR
jgi:hypothetical protein